MSSRLGSFFATLVAALCCAVCLCANVQAAPPRAPVEQMAAPAPAPSQPKASRPKVAAYFEAGPYWEFTLLQKEIIKALRQRGVVDRVILPDELYISPGWDASESVYRAEARKLMQNPDIDVIISMGTEATKALLAENNGRTPIMSVDVADPAGAGIVDRATGKGAANLTIRYTKDKWFKVFALFHEALPFLRLGIMYHDSPEGLSYSNVREAREVARERGFTLVEYPFLDKAESIESCTRGVDRLMAAGVDAFYISALNCFDWTQANPQAIFDTLNAHHIKTFARDGSVHVRRGALMGLSTLDYVPLGKFYADHIAAQLGLLPPNTQLETAAYTPKIALNLVTAQKMGMDLPLILLISADELFDVTLAGVDKTVVAQ
ncbi:MAG TPA: ABC transporter substrate binding protein [Desulfovibrio sp.]|uniref:ABC transporter substrate binding protein n=1 Tax=Desulfovibrio sp. TaxID=885 RepID=UPI002D3B3367|nr:ABC transporter substrate binding protein [Desulfovibrio sp.]HZF62334.1 ABC transporter substrate binding protein [Desulfovibrio sp.]